MRLLTRIEQAAAERKARRRQGRSTTTESGQQLVQGMSAHDLMYRFESIGDNCEFGLVQRQCGAEPLGLLRFALTPPDSLARALEARLDGMADAESIEVFPSKDDLAARNRRYGIQFAHTGFLASETALETARPLIVRRLALLTRKLRETLEEGEKIFVFRSRDYDDASMLRLSRALRSFGPNTLLWVTDAPPPDRVGSVEPIGPGILRALIEPYSNWDGFAIETWMAICGQAYVEWRRDRPEAAAAADPSRRARPAQI